jgi:hypothetical protein
MRSAEGLRSAPTVAQQLNAVISSTSVQDDESGPPQSSSPPSRDRTSLRISYIKQAASPAIHAEELLHFYSPSGRWKNSPQRPRFLPPFHRYRDLCGNLLTKSCRSPKSMPYNATAELCTRPISCRIVYLDTSRRGSQEGGRLYTRRCHCRAPSSSQDSLLDLHNDGTHRSIAKPDTKPNISSLREIDYGKAPA